MNWSQDQSIFVRHHLCPHLSLMFSVKYIFEFERNVSVNSIK